MQTDSEVVALGTLVRTTCDIETQPEGFPLMVVAPKGTEGRVVEFCPYMRYQYIVHMRTTALDKPAGFTEDVYLARSEFEVVDAS